MSTLVIDPPISKVVESTLDIGALLGGDEWPSDVYVLAVPVGKHVAINFDTKGFEPEPQLNKTGLVCHADESSAKSHIELQELPPGAEPKMVSLDEAVDIAKAKGFDAVLLMTKNKIKQIRFVK